MQQQVQVALIAVGLLLPLGVGLSWLGLRTMDRTTLVPTHTVRGRTAIRRPIRDPETHVYVRTTVFIAPFTVLIGLVTIGVIVATILQKRGMAKSPG